MRRLKGHAHLRQRDSHYQKNPTNSSKNGKHFRVCRLAAINSFDLIAILIHPYGYAHSPLLISPSSMYYIEGKMNESSPTSYHSPIGISLLTHHPNPGSSQWPILFRGRCQTVIHRSDETLPTLKLYPFANRQSDRLVAYMSGSTRLCKMRHLRVVQMLHPQLLKMVFLASSFLFASPWQHFFPAATEGLVGYKDKGLAMDSCCEKLLPRAKDSSSVGLDGRVPESAYSIGGFKTIELEYLLVEKGCCSQVSSVSAGLIVVDQVSRPSADVAESLPSPLLKKGIVTARTRKLLTEPTSGKSIGEEISGQEQIGKESGSPTMRAIELAWKIEQRRERRRSGCRRTGMLTH
ncbi:hypothetical protein COLO4_23821 [Corchorus olitorius]|uniref:Uncharacterized protein n=1 Tax=Corchorus olitorius TaxID=93759 RepID=A0A1R3IEG4_9ROSI|nr:hypothetical protein COLO4_23821 [Corchorus olitorius]